MDIDTNEWIRRGVIDGLIAPGPRLKHLEMLYDPSVDSAPRMFSDFCAAERIPYFTGLTIKRLLDGDYYKLSNVQRCWLIWLEKIWEREIEILREI